MGVARSGLGVSLLPVGGGGHFEKAQRITDPPIHSSFLEMTPHEFYILKATPPPTYWCEDYEYSSYK